MKERKKRKIINVSIDLFAKNGIRNVSVAKIAEKIGVSRGMIYHNFRKGKKDIVAAILEMYEDCVSANIPNPKQWGSKDADAKEILSKLFFQFPDEEVLFYRKIVHIILSEMFINEQVKEYILNKFILEREKVLAHCFLSLAGNERIAPIDAESTSRFLNRLLIVYAIEDALRYPNQDTDSEKLQLMFRDCNNLMGYILARKRCL